MKKKSLSLSIRSAMLCMFLLFASLQGHAWNVAETEIQPTITINNDSIAQPQLKNSTFWQKMFTPVKWVMKNWTAYDPDYSIPSFYNFVFQLQNTTSMEWVRMWTPEGMDITMHSKMSNRIGPYVGYAFLMFGTTVDLNALKGSNDRDEFTLSINSNLFNIDLIRRRTGGDFSVSRLKGAFEDPVAGKIRTYDFHDFAHADKDMGDMVRIGITGVNINYFTNHRRYSNPAAFSNGAIQLRSAGSPIIGLGFVHQTITNHIGELIDDYAIRKSMSDMTDDQKESFLAIVNEGRTDKIKTLSEYGQYMTDAYKSDPAKHKSELKSFFNNSVVQPFIFGQREAGGSGISGFKDSGLLGYYTNGIPSNITINDFHLQLGYAYNLVFSRRLLLGMSIITSPSLKSVKYNNEDNYIARSAEDLTDAMNQYYGKSDEEAYTPDFIRINQSYNGFGLNAFGRLSLTYNYDRWRAGVNINASTYHFMNKDFFMADTYGSATVYVGWCFGRKKQFKDGQRDNTTFVTTALSKQQIAEKLDTMPEGNLGRGNAFLQQEGKTKYKNDRLDFEFYGCDLVKGPDGNYGSFVVEDGIVAPGEDTENRLRPGTALTMDEKGDIIIPAGHKNSFLPANWWKQQLTPRQVSYNEFTEMLHYALKGKLIIYVRNPQFGTKEPVKVVFDDFYLCHGKDYKNFFQVAAKGFESHSSYSIIGHADINNRLCRVYIEAKEYGNRHDVYINMMRATGRSWMSRLPDDRPISHVSIPGTHDAGTASLYESGVNSAAHTQNFTITEQLEDGIRAFDIRLKGNMKFGHMFECRDGFDDTMIDIKKFLTENPSEFIIALIGSDEGGKWSDEMKKNYLDLIGKYPGMFVEHFDATTKVEDVRGKILVIRRQEACPFGKLLKFEDNAVFNYDCFCVEDVYKEHKTYKKTKIVEQHLRDAFENDDPAKWYITFNSIAWDPRHHKPYYTAWGSAVNVRSPMNPTLRELIVNKQYTNLGVVFLDFYNDHGDKPQLIEAIVNSNFRLSSNEDYIPVNP